MAATILGRSHLGAPLSVLALELVVSVRVDLE
jgi:hypothetical protein